MNIFRKNNGAVSVFLVIILVPCMLAASIFVDLGRVSLSKTMANSSADLALNTLMTNYDADLKEWYGMVVSCQSIDKFYEISAQYFLRTLSSQGLSDDEIVLLSDYYANVTNDDTIYDLLDVEIVSEPVVSAVSGADMTNSAMIKDQIVEFMKYRAPITIAEEFIDKLRGDTGISNVLDSDDNKELTGAKKDFYNTEGELVETSFYTYDYLYNRYTVKNVTNEKLQGILDNLSQYRELYREIHKIMVSNLYNTEGLTVFKRPTADINGYQYSKADSTIYSRKADEDGTTHYYIDGNDLDKLYKELETAITEFNRAKNNVISSGETVAYGTDTNDIQYWKRLNEAINSSRGTNYINELKNAGNRLLDAYGKMKAAVECDEGSGFPAVYYKDEITEIKYTYNDYCSKYENDLKPQVENIHMRYLSAGIADDSDGYLRLIGRLERISSANVNNINWQLVTISTGETIEAALSRMAADMSAGRNELSGYIDDLNIVINGNSDKNIASLDSLKALADSYHTDFNQWENIAYGKTTDMAEEDRTEIQDKKSKEFADKITGESVSEMKNRLNNIKSQLQSVIDAIDSLQYGGEHVYNIKDYNTFKGKASGTVNSESIGLTNGEITLYAGSTLKQLFTPYSDSKTAVASLNSADIYNALLNPDSGNVAVPELYKYLRVQFKNADKSQVESYEDESEDAINEAESLKEAAKNKQANTNAEEITREFSPENTEFEMLESAYRGLTDLIGNIMGGNIEGIRDKLYIGTYMTNMFSYATYENEGLYSLVPEEKKAALKKSTYEKEYQNVMGNAKTENTWLSEKVTDSYNKSLTNKMINSTNNAAYGCEIEYILYGKSNQENVKAAYGDIYTIRFVLNEISAFQHFWKTSTNTGFAINAVADSIASITYGIIPQPVTKIVLITLLSLFETNNDINRLEAGFPVELYKADESDWQYSLEKNSGSDGSVSSIMTKLKGIGDFTNSNKGLQYSDYLTIFIYLGLSDDNMCEPMCLRMAEVIQKNMQKVTGDSDYKLSKAKLYFELNATVRVRPLMVNLPYFSGQYGNNMETATDWCTYNINIIRGY